MPTYETLPLVPENTLDPAAGLNDALRVMEAIAQPTVISMSIGTPPVGPVDRDRHIVGPGATGLWAGKENYLVEYIAAVGYYFYAPGTLVKSVINMEDGALYYFDTTVSPGEWVPANIVT